MNKFLLIVFVFVSVSLIISIMIQLGNGVDGVNSFGNFYSNKKISFNIKNKIFFRVSKYFSILFFLISLILCNINNNKSMKKNFIDHEKIVFSSFKKKSV